MFVLTDIFTRRDLSSHIAHNFILSHIEVTQAEGAKLNVVLGIIGRTLKIDTTPEEEKDEGATSASAVFNDIINSHSPMNSSMLTVLRQHSTGWVVDATDA